MTGPDFALPPELDALRLEAERLAGDWTRDAPIREDSWLIGHDRAFAAELGRRGWIGMTWPVEAGGGGRSPLERFVVYETLISAGAPIAGMWFCDRQIGPTLLQFGDDAQRHRWLPGMIAGEQAWCIGMSEPDAGSDVAAIRTAARRVGGVWVVDGAKIWTSGAADADWIYLVARTDPEAPRHKGLSELVVDMRSPGIEVRPIVDATGDGHFCEVRFDGVEVPAANLIGTENGSFRQVMRQMEHERGGIDRLVSNRALYLDVLRSGLVDRDDPVVREELARLETGYRIGRLLVLREVLGQAPPGFSAATKTFGTEFEQRVSAFCARACGPAATGWGPQDGLSRRAARSAVYAPAYTIMGGTTQILRNILAERVLGLPR